MTDHLGVNDIPKAKSLENNDRSTALPVNGAGTSPHICAETVPLPRLTREQRANLRILAKHPTYRHHAQRVLTQFRLLAISPNDLDLRRATRASVAALADMKGA